MLDGDFSRTELSEAVAAATCMTDFLNRLGVTPSNYARRRMFERLKRLGIERTRWHHSPNRLYTREELQAAVAVSTSFAGVLRALRLPQAGGSQSYLARRIRAEGIDTDHFTGQAHNRGKSEPRLSADDVLVVSPTGAHRRRTTQLRRALREKGVPERCDGCRIGPTWHGAPLTLVIEHRNANWLDNRLQNLRLLCPNCHSQTATWCRRKGS
jgi:hypothetical protein